MSDDSHINRLIDVFEEQARAFLEHPDMGPAVAQRLRRLLPAPPPPPPPETPERMALAIALPALRASERRAHVRDQPQIRGAISQIRRALGVPPEEPSAPSRLPQGDERAPGPIPAAADPAAAPVTRGAVAA